MDEFELRLAAIELAFLEVAAWLDPAALADARASIAAGLAPDVAGDADEIAIRRGAIQLIDDARGRLAPNAIGLAIKP